MTSVTDVVNKVMNKYNIPAYVWLPIMMNESGGNPNADTGDLATERSIGLFQINLKAHPQWQNVDLTNPAVNAEIAAQYFLKDAYRSALTQGLSETETTAYVWKNGIRPKWTEAKYQKITSMTQDYLDGKDITKTDYQTDANPDDGSIINGSNGSSNSSGTGISGLIDNLNSLLTEKLPNFGWILLGVVVAIIGVYFLFSDEGSATA